MKQSYTHNQKIKKMLSLVITVFAILAIMLGCMYGCEKPNQITSYYKKLQRAKSLTVEVSVAVPIFGDTKIIMQKDGNKTYTTGAVLLSKPEVYTQTQGDTMYIYSKNIQGNWIKNSVDADTSNPVSIDNYRKVFKASDYTYDDEANEYIMKDNISYEIMEGVEATKVILSFSGDICNARGKISTNGMTMAFTLIVKDLNATEIRLPNVS